MIIKAQRRTARTRKVQKKFMKKEDDDEDFLPLLIAGATVAKGAFDAYGAEKNRKNQIAGLRKMAEVTPAERAYEKRRRDIIKNGDPLINEAGNKAIQTVRQQGQFGRQRAQGQAIQQGMEGSIVAQELRRKVDKDVLKSVAEQARQMALANAQAKRTAEGEMENMNLKTDARQQQAKGQIAQIGGYDRWGTLGKIALSGVTSYMSAGGNFNGAISNPSAMQAYGGGYIDVNTGIQYDKDMMKWKGE